MSGHNQPNRMNTQYELFCSHVASGMSYGRAAETCGFSAQYGKQLMAKPHIAAKVEQLRAIKAAQPPDSIASKAWIETQLVTIIRNALNPAPKEIEEIVQPAKPDMGPPQIVTKKIDRDPDPSLARLALMDLARLKGYLIDRKEIETRKIDLRLMDRTELSAQLTSYLQQLSPAQRERIQAIASGADLIEGSVEVLESESTQ